MENKKMRAFSYQEDGEGGLCFLGAEADEFQMNWAEGHKSWGTIICPQGICATVKRRLLPEGQLEERYCFENVSRFPIFFQKTEVGIYTTFPDDYEEPKRCLTERCHTHIFCGGAGSYVMALRMGGRPPHLGLLLTEGSLGAYSVERNPQSESNDRGDFILHPQLPPLAPGEKTEIAWELFWFEDRKEFEAYRIRRGQVPALQMRQCVYFPGETVEFDLLVGENVRDGQLTALCNDRPVQMQEEDREGVRCIRCRYPAQEPGEYRIQIRAAGREIQALSYVSPDLHELVRSRCRFIARKQQYRGRIQAYQIFGRMEYLSGAKEQIRLLELFHG